MLQSNSLGNLQQSASAWAISPSVRDSVNNLALLQPLIDRFRELTAHRPVPHPQFEIRSVVKDHAQYVWRALRHLGVREADVEDACQDVFVVLHRRLSDFRGDSSIKTWIYGICVRVASEYRRRAHVVREVPEAEPATLAQPPEQIEQVARRESLERLAGILDQLDDEKRAVFVLYELEELSMTNVAKAVECPIQTAYSRQHAARRLVTEAAAKFDPLRSS